MTSTSASSAGPSRGGVELARPAARARRRRGCRHPAARSAASRGSACRRAGGSWRSTRRPSSWSPCRGRSRHRPRAGAPCLARARTPGAPPRACAVAATSAPCAERGCISPWTDSRQEAVVDEEVLLDRQRGVEPLEVAGAIAARRDAAASGPARGPARESDRPGRSRSASTAARCWSGGKNVRATARRRRPSMLRGVAAS